MTRSSPGSTLRLLQTACYYLLTVTVGFIVAAWGPSLPSLADHTGTSLGQIGLLFTTNSLGFLLGALLAGGIFDSIPGHRAIVPGLAVVTLAFFLIPLITSLWLLVAVAFVNGIASAMLVVGPNVLLTRIHQENVGPWLNGLHFFFGVGAFFSPILIAQVLNATGDVVWAFRAIALGALLCGVWMATLASPPLPPPPTSHEESRLRWPILLPIALFFLLYTGAEQSYAGWLFSYTTALYPGSDLQAGYLTSAFWGAFTIGRLLAIPVAARVKASTLVFVALSGAALSLGVLLLAPSLDGLWVGTLALGLMMASIFPTMLVFARSRMPLTGRVTGVFFSASGVGGMTLPLLSGQLFVGVGPRLVMAVQLVAVIAMLGVFAGVNLAGRRAAEVEGGVV